MKEIKVGQIWQECDNRFVRKVKILGFTYLDKVLIETVGGAGRITEAARSRFNGKSHGYKLIQESPNA